MTWGLMRLEERKAPGLVTKTRDDQIHTNAFWLESFHESHAWYQRRPSANPTATYSLDLKGEDERPLFAFPGMSGLARQRLSQKCKPCREARQRPTGERQSKGIKLPPTIVPARVTRVQPVRTSAPS
jgi:hypothetical protein